MPFFYFFAERRFSLPLHHSSDSSTKCRCVVSWKNPGLANLFQTSQTDMETVPPWLYLEEVTVSHRTLYSVNLLLRRICIFFSFCEGVPGEMSKVVSGEILPSLQQLRKPHLGSKMLPCGQNILLQNTFNRIFMASQQAGVYLDSRYFLMLPTNVFLVGLSGTTFLGSWLALPVWLLMLQLSDRLTDTAFLFFMVWAWQCVCSGRSILLAAVKNKCFTRLMRQPSSPIVPKNWLSLCTSLLLELKIAPWFFFLKSTPTEGMPLMARTLKIHVMIFISESRIRKTSA